ncbi:GNAT family N-acetyltransferase [Flavobacterium cheniae]|jgi:ribosomal protein S18 acetylase RimI-like enzyme|uniref:Ribosomal protein S18 acetylase RimI-like enzyme n=1 Tax=Flavobacterium cheniae TaxID=295428 RepID=A0A562KE52_9FLAO|nr:GNAT family N-acetyltransferase [Flavobacterium cheniae]TDR19691.1 ribosomal protein S18 acetylase RimI-like enzyme [Flavobacterium cheniae]TWH93503.1 ribosomal protein S18 acetylase RimI-like enzyme [Flavobacterium cheniae]
MKLTALKIEQLPIVIDLTKKIWPVAYGEILSKAQLDYMIDKFYNETALRELMQKSHVFYLAQDNNGKDVGFVSYEINSEPNKTKIHKIYVLPETQGTGLGRQFFELVKEKAIENQQNAIFLNVNKYNNAIHFYSKLGFTKVKDEVIDIGNGYVMDDYVMEVVI